MRFVFEASSRCVGVCFASYIYILSFGDIYIYIYICFWHGAVRVFRIARFYNLDVHGFGFWKNKLRLSVLMKLYFSFSQKEAESSF